MNIWFPFIACACCIGLGVAWLLRGIDLLTKKPSVLTSGDTVIKRESAEPWTGAIHYNEEPPFQDIQLEGKSIFRITAPSLDRNGNYTFPDKPEDVTIQLWTKDDREWVAKWEEKK